VQVVRNSTGVRDPPACRDGPRHRGGSV